MTVIVGLVGKKGVLIAGDAQSSTDWIKREDTSAKVFELRETVVVGYCGSGRFGQILQYHMDTLEAPALQMDEHKWLVKEFVPKLRDVTEFHGHLHVHHNVEEFGPSAFLIGVRGRLFCIESDFSVNEHVMPYEAVGSGAETAMGSMHGELGNIYEPLSDAKLQAIAERAISAATTLTLYVGGDITSVKTVRYTAEEKTLAREVLGK
jgi:20S proteasome alpha/beta subunit